MALYRRKATGRRNQYPSLLLLDDVRSESQFLLLRSSLFGESFDDGVASGNFGRGGLELLFSIFQSPLQIFAEIRISLTSFVRELSSSVGALHRVLGILRPLF